MIEALVEKYRPKNLDQMVGNHEIIQILKTLSTLPNLLFYGPPGTGKTTAIKILSQGHTVLELNASDDRGIDIVRAQIKEFSLVAGRRLVILDEADSMSRDAQNALRRIIEDTDTRFCLICNYVNKIIAPIQSRFTRFRFSPIERAEMKRRIEGICDIENIKVVSGLDFLVEMAQGDMRTALNDLEGVWRGFGEVTVDNVYRFTGLSSVEYDMKRMDEILDRIEGVIDGRTICQQVAEKMRGWDVKDKWKKMEKLAEIEYNFAIGCTEKHQLRGIKYLFKEYEIKTE